jgi:hypothetical protein
MELLNYFRSFNGRVRGEEKRKACRMLVGKPKRKIPLRSPRRRLMDCC